VGGVRTGGVRVEHLVVGSEEELDRRKTLSFRKNKVGQVDCKSCSLPQRGRSLGLPGLPQMRSGVRLASSLPYEKFPWHFSGKEGTCLDNDGQDWQHDAKLLLNTQDC
jgi:hypothetical protein